MATWEAVNLALAVAASGNGGDFLYAGRHLAAAIFERLSQVVQAHQGSSYS